MRHNKGFALPTVIILTMVMSVVAYATLLQANNLLILSYKHSYQQIARTASKAALDYAQEQFDNAPCGAYNGTPEMDIISNSRYRVTIKADVISTSADGYEKVIQGTGSVYLPRLSQDAKYVFDVKAELVRTYATCKTPDNFAPKLWLDANDTTTLRGPATTTVTNVPATTGFGWLDLFLPNDTVEEKASDGTQGPLSWLSNDLEMHRCDSVEFLFILCSNPSTRDINIGLVFRSVNVPKDATITSATIQFTGKSSGQVGGSVTHRTFGYYKTSTNPHPDFYSATASNQVRTPLNTANLHTTNFTDTTTNNFPPGNVTNFDVTNVVQEIVNQPNWDPANATNGGRIGFIIRRQAGTGSRTAYKDGIRLTITYSTTSIAQATNGGGVGQWDDKSGNGNHAVFVYGNSPTRQDNQINGQTVVRFNNGAMVSNLLNPIANANESTVFAVAKADFSTSSNEGRLITGTNTSINNDTTAPNSINPIFRNTGSSGFSSNYSGGISAYRTNYNCTTSCANTPYIYTSIFDHIPSSSNVTAILKGNGATRDTQTGISPSNPYTYTINQLYIGGRRNGAVIGGSGQDYFNGDYAELIYYDYALSCRQVEAIEEYLRNKWAISASQYSTECPSDTIPTL